MNSFGKLTVGFQIRNQTKFDILMLDPYTFNGIRYNERSFEGDQISDGTTNYNLFDVNTESEELEPQDESVFCQDYDNTYTFKECIERVVEKELEFLGCNLPWFTDNQKLICRHDTPNISETILKHYEQYMDIFQKFAIDKHIPVEFCKSPCMSLKIKSEKKAAFNLKLNYTLISVDFNPFVKRTRSICKITLMDLMVNIGSSLGLWLGISIFSLFNSLKDFGLTLERKCFATLLSGLGFVLVLFVVALSLNFIV